VPTAATAAVDAPEHEPEVAAEGDRTAFVLGGRLWHRPSLAGLLALTTLATLITLPLRGLYRATGSSMEEGFMLVFPERLWKGDVPNVDFLHLYGPGSLYALAGWYRVFGTDLASERTFGLLQHVALILGIYALARAWGHLAALVSAAAATLLVLTPIGLSALAWEGGLALGVWALVAGLRAGYVEGGARLRCLVAAGVLAALALCFRPDLVLALTIALVFVAWQQRASWKPLVAGAALGILPMVVHVVRAGPAKAFSGMVLDPVFRLRPGRELPRPPSWSRIDGALQAVAEGVPPWWRLPALPAQHQLFVWFFAVVIIAVAVPVGGFLLARRHGWTPRRTILVGAGLYGLGILPQAWQRPDSTHLAWVACLSWSLLPLLIVEVWRARRPAERPVVPILAGGIVVAALFFVVCPFYTYRHYVLHTRVAVGDLPPPFEVRRDGRNFWFGEAAVARASQAAIDDLDRLSTPGQRLAVGPADLSRTIYSDVAFYHLFPELPPATYFIEMDPGLADKDGSRLAADLETADWIILTNFWTGWYEPNASSKYGSEAANDVVAEDFCLVGNYEDALVLLYRRCGAGDGISPAALGDRPPPEGGAKPARP
jgi:hypothetical protein